MADLKEYVVTAASREVLDDLCNDIETEGGALYIPNRAVEVANLRPMSRNTNYYLTDEEAELLRKDPRVLSVVQPLSARGIVPKPVFVQTSNEWDKSDTVSSFHKNWGLLRCVDGANRLNWNPQVVPSVSGSVQVNAEGRNVDIVVVDGHIDPNHPEFAINADGTGGSRVIQYNWFQHNPVVAGTPSSNYVYGNYTNAEELDDNNHGTHVAGTIFGNTQGWARRANIYNISPYATNPNVFDYDLLIDYIRAFHAAKAINTTTGRKNPTITNHSWAYELGFPIADITSIRYRGVTYAGPFTAQQILSYGMVSSNGVVVLQAREPYVDADIEDAIADGIIFVCAAGNRSFKIDVSTGADYNNYFTAYGFNFYYHRGATPGSSANVITVGAIDNSWQDLSSNLEEKVWFSNTGPRINVFAPGSAIASSTLTGGVPDTRNGAYYIDKYSGTSMACPQVCGVLACLLEIYPEINQTKVVEYIDFYSKPNQIIDSNGGYSDFYSLQGAPNKYLFYYKERADAGAVSPKVNYFTRPTSGQVFPRTIIKR